MLSKAEYDALLEAAAEAAEDVDDAALYAQRKAALRPEDIFPAPLSALILKGDSRLRAIRKWRGMGQVELAQAAGIAQSYLSALETGDRKLTAELAERMASALSVPITWIEA